MSVQSVSVVGRAVRAGLLDQTEAPIAAFLDLDVVEDNVRALHEAFPANVEVLHAFAVKANSLPPVLGLLRELGMGAEVASEGELQLALASGAVADRIVFDSPAKSVRELSEALRLGVAINIDNLQELDRVDALRTEIPSTSTLGIRLNPQVGLGDIAAMSTAGAESKFGIGLEDDGMRSWLVQAYLDRPWLTAVHAHIGSQGCPLELIGEGLRRVVEFADEVNARAGEQRIRTIDIGGGLGVDFGSDETRSAFDAYVRAVGAAAPRLFSGDFTLVTEFGRSILAKAGAIAAYVEYTKQAGERQIAITHAGAQIATRTVFMPDAWPLRVRAYDAAGRAKTGAECVQDVAGPCCFAGDIVAHQRRLPLLEPGDVVTLLDTGAYYASTPFSYNSLPEPGVYAFRGSDPDGGFDTLRAPQTMAELLARHGVGSAALVG